MKYTALHIIGWILARR